MKCGKPLSDETQEYCEECESVTRYFNQGISIWRHSDIVSKSLYCFKYQKKKRYAVFYIEEITPDTVKKLSWWKAQALVPVPLGKKRRRVRGYNQALLLAHALEERLGIPVVDCAVRIKETVPQKELSKKKRIENMHNAFKVNLKSPLKRVIIIDDIFTTGSTVDAIATELKKEGVEEVFFLTISIGQGN